MVCEGACERYLRAPFVNTDCEGCLPDRLDFGDHMSVVVLIA
jgi:hypothetical protein